MININRDDYYIVHFDRYIFAVEKKTDGKMGYEEVNWRKALEEFTEYMEIKITRDEDKNEL